MKKLCSWNVNGLRACMKKGFLDFLEKEAPDILCVQETKMQPEQADFEFPGIRGVLEQRGEEGIFGDSGADEGEAVVCVL